MVEKSVDIKSPYKNSSRGSKQRAPNIGAKKPGEREKEAMDKLRSNPGISFAVLIGAGAIAFSVWITDKGDPVDNCSSVNKALVQVGSVSGPWLEQKNWIRSALDTVTFGKLMNDGRTLSGVATELSKDRGYGIPVERLLAVNQDQPFVRFDESGDLIQKMPVQFSEGGSFCVNVPPPIYGGYELIQDSSVTLGKIASQHMIASTALHALNPSLNETKDDTLLPVGSTIRTSETIDTSLVYRVMTDNEKNINVLSNNNPVLRQQIVNANISVIADGVGIKSGESAFLPLVQTADTKAKSLTPDALIAAYSPDSVPLDVGFIAQAKLSAELKAPAEPLAPEVIQAEAVPQTADGVIPTAESAGAISIDVAKYGETVWSSEDLTRIQENLPIYLEAERATGVPWQFLAVIHKRESNIARSGPGNGQGPYQIFSERGTHKVGDLTDDEFKQETLHAADLIANGYAKRGVVQGPFKADNFEMIKDVFFSYNGRAKVYTQQAALLGFNKDTQPFEGSPYVMNLADDQRNSAKNPNWKQYRSDQGNLTAANNIPGAFIFYRDLLKVTEFAPDIPTRQQLETKYGGVSGHLADSELQVIGPEWGGNRLNGAAAAAFRQMNAAYKAETGKDLLLNSTYRSYDQQIATKASRGKLAADPGESIHGWGDAIDFNLDADGYGWLDQHAADYGWVHPDWAKPGGSLPERWHWEYVK